MNQRIIFTVLFVCTIIFSNVYSQVTPELRIQLGHKDDVNKVLFDAKGKRVYSCSNDKTIKVWDVVSGKELYTLAGHENGVKNIALSSDGNKLLSCGDKKEKVIFVWDLKTRSIEKKLIGLIGEALDIKVDDFFNRALVVEAGSSFETRVGIWDLKTGTLTVEFKKQKNFFPKTADFDSKGVNVVIAGKMLTKGKTNNVKIYESTSGKEIVTFKDTDNDIAKVFYGTADQKILSIGNSIQFWNPVTHEKEIGYSDFASDGFLSRDGHYGVFSSKRSIYVYDFFAAKKMYVIEGHEKTVTSVAISPDNKYLLSADMSGELYFWDLQSGHAIPHFKGHKADVVQQVKFDSKDKYLYTVVNDKNVQVWDMANMKLEFLSVTPKRANKKFQISSIDLSPDGKTAVLTPNLDKGVFLYDLKSKKEIRFLKNSSFVKNAVFSSTGKYIACGGKDKKIVVWEPAKEEPLFKLIGHNSQINSLVFTKNDEFLYSGSNDKTLKQWSINSQSLLTTVPTKYYVNSLCFDPSEKFILGACGNKQDVFRKNASELLEWELTNLNEYAKKKSNTLPKSFIGHSMAVLDAKYNYDGTKVASASVDNKVVLWDAQTGNKLKEMEGHSSAVNSLCFGNKTAILASGGSDAIVKLWDAESGNELLNVLTFDNGKDYILFTNENYYSCTKEGISNVHFVMKDKVYLFEQFDLRLNRPDIVASRFPNANKSLVSAYNKAYKKRLRKMGFTMEMLGDDFNIPEIQITNSEEIPYLVNEKMLTININATDNSTYLDRINVWINDVPIYGMKGIDLRGQNKKSLDKSIELELSNGKNKIQISVLNQKGAESFKQEKFVYYKAPEQKNDLYVIAIGVSEFSNKEFNLDYAAKDARDIVNLFTAQNGSFENVYTKLITNTEATTQNIKSVKNMLMQSKVDDQVVVFVASHGLLDEKLDYYLATTNVNFYNPSENGLLYEELESIIDGIPARKKLVFIDACHSGEVDEEEAVLVDADTDQSSGNGVKSRGFKKVSSSGLGMANTFELMNQLFADLRRGNGAMVISSAGGEEYAFESSEWNNGVFTYSLLEGLKTKKADLNKDSKVTTSELKEYISKNVQKLTNGKQNPTSRQENLENDYKVWDY